MRDTPEAAERLQLALERREVVRWEWDAARGMARASALDGSWSVLVAPTSGLAPSELGEHVGRRRD